MNFGELYAELEARGFSHLLLARRKQIVNDAVAELDESQPWPYREKSATGASPLAISDLGTIEMVLNTSQSDVPLTPATYQWLVEMFGDLTTAGTPVYWYSGWPSGDPVVATFPVSSNDVLGVQYWRTSPTLSADADTPLAPSRFHSIILLIAQRMAESERGNLNVAAGLQQEIDRMISRMIDALLGGQQLQGAQDQVRVWTADDC